MSARAWTQWVAIAVVVIMAVGSLGLVGIGLAAPPGHAASVSTATAVSPVTTAPATSTPATTVSPSSSAASNAAQAAGARALAAAKSAGISPTTVFVPRPSASASQIAASAANGTVTPLYKATPAPIGLAEYGLADNGTGNVTPFILNTTSVQATFDPSINGPNATDLADSSPDGYGVQLNAVTTNVTLFGQAGYSFWTQNVVEYFPYIGEMVLVTNVWNFSSAASYLSPNVFYQHGPYGVQVGTDYYYAELIVPTAVFYPFNLTLTLAQGIVDGRNAVNFSVQLTEPNGSTIFSAPNYDWVIFNSLANGTTPLTTPSNYTANGYTYNPLGLTDDFELTLGGPGGGSQTTFLSANVTESLSYWNTTSSSYQAVPSAFSYGGETGETSVGVGVSWATGDNGQPYGILTTGASLLSGLWNASSPSGGPGYLDLSEVSPTNTFVLVAFAGASQGPFNVSEFEWAATVNTNLLTLPAGTYAVYLGLSDYTSILLSVTINASEVTSINETLAWNPSAGVYTPLWAWTNQQIAAISTIGIGTIQDPYVIVNNQNGSLLPVFGVLNDYGFPVFPGVYFLGTTAYTEFVNPPSFEVASSAPNLPTTNNLPYWFYGVSNVAIVNATDISGWFSIYAYEYPFFLTFNVVFWNSTNTLIYNDTFNTQAQALLLYNGFTSANPFAAGNATIWGNTFEQAPQPIGGVVPYSYGLGLSEQENFDLIYNNYFSTPTTAVSLPFDLYTGEVLPYVNTWNITPTNASAVNTVGNWPAFSLTGSIIGGTTQGGNFWWDYGLSESPYGLVQYAFLGPNFNSNPYGVLPYTETYWIDPFGLGIGDYAPLTSTPLYSITIAEQGLPTPVGWQFVIVPPPLVESSWIYYNISTGYTNETVFLPGASYLVIATGPFGYSAAAQIFTVTGNATVWLNFTATPSTVQFVASGLPQGSQWIVQFAGTVATTTTDSINISGVQPGPYDYYVTALSPDWTANPSSGLVRAGGGLIVINVTFTPYTAAYDVYFTASGIWPGTTWSLDFNGTNYTTNSTTLEIFDVPAGSVYWYNVTAPAGYVSYPQTGWVSVSNSAVSVGLTFIPITYTVSFQETGLANGTWWAVELGGVVYGSDTQWINFTVTPGTYDFLVGYLAEYSAAPDGGAVSVSSAWTVYILFTPT